MTQYGTDAFAPKEFKQQASQIVADLEQKHRCQAEEDQEAEEICRGGHEDG